MGKSELTQSVQRKEKESAAIGAKIEDEATLGSKYSKQTKELQSRLEELDEELSIERGNRAKAEKSRAMLKKDLEDLGSRLEEAGANTATQVELNKKREGELGRLKGELAAREVQVHDLMCFEDGKFTKVTKVVDVVLDRKVSVNTLSGTLYGNGVLTTGMCDNRPLNTPTS